MNKLAMLTGVCAVVSLMSCTSHKEETEEAGKYNVTSPIVMDTSYTKEYVAQLQSIQNVEIHALVKGYLEKINTDEGKLVKEGEVLFNIMPKQYQAEYAKAKANARTLELELTNVKKLQEKNIVSETELSIAQSKLDEANAELASAELELGFTEIKAPFEGTLDRIRFKTGSLIDEGTLLTSISNNKEVYAYFNMSEIEYLDFKNRPNTEDKNLVTLLLANGQVHKYKGSIETIESEFDNNTGNIAFRAKFPNPELLIKHGETGKVRLTIPIQNALIIPQKATYELQDKIYVYVVGKDNVVRSKNISIKQRLPNIYIIDADQLTVNDRILLDGLQSVKDDDKIEPEFVPAQKVIQSLQLIKQ
ncbi:MAG TPA: efflux RND transporter periplasmic adaptor subunit [Bacteroidia bacterium]|jgi:membrane fusion protein (multidrug efflux system)|nr:efflux RND transporter periplasmic adaptor subunit [Bacteroidia bacterium]